MTVSKTTTQEKARQYCLDIGYSPVGSESMGPWIAAFADSLTAELQKENARQKQALDMLREMAEAKPDMKLVGAAAVILGMLQPLTESDIKRGQEIAALLVENERLTAELRGISAASNTSWLADRARRAISPKGGAVQERLPKEKAK